MKQRNNIFAGCSVAIALGAVGVGALVSSNAMAASDDPADAEVTIGMVSIAEDGSAFECTLDVTDFSDLAPIEITGSGAAALPLGDPFVVGGESTVSGWAGVDGVEQELTVGGGTVTASGTVTEFEVPVDGGVFQVDATGAVEAVEVRQGTESECAEALADAQP